MNPRIERTKSLASAFASAFASVDPKHAAEDKTDFEQIKGIVDKMEDRDVKDAEAEAAGPSKRPDVSQSDKDTADAKYGSDPNYADPKNHKYPLDSEKHVRAAWAYIHMEHNAAKYSADEVATICGRIESAAKKYGIDLSGDGKAAVEVGDFIAMAAEWDESAHPRGKDGKFGPGGGGPDRDRSNDTIFEHGGLSDHGAFSYKMTPDVMETPEKKYFIKSTNGPLTIHEGPLANSPEKAKEIGKEHMRIHNPGLFQNTYHEWAKPRS